MTCRCSLSAPGTSITRIGVYVYGIASLAAGIMDLVWGEFESAHQPIQALGDQIPGVELLAYIAAVWLLVGGAGILSRRTARAGAAALAVIYCIFAAFSFPRFYTAPRILGYRATVYIGVLGGLGQQLILVVAAVVVYASLDARDSLSRRTARVARWTFGLCAIDFGLAHLTGVRAVAPLVPHWMPMGGDFWTVLTGIAFAVAGIAVVSGLLDVLASRLLALMLLIFSGLALVPLIFAYPRDHVAWGSNAYNLAAVGAAWIVADWLASRQQLVEDPEGAKQTNRSLA
ncbi:MAG: hypothetical protein M3R65_07905 [Gemmatimonadota bacterium]|nr:hypothetical protein [Gemmatimonadota bacterium]